MSDGSCISQTVGWQLSEAPTAVIGPKDTTQSPIEFGIRKSPQSLIDTTQNATPNTADTRCSQSIHESSEPVRCCHTGRHSSAGLLSTDFCKESSRCSGSYGYSTRQLHASVRGGCQREKGMHRPLLKGSIAVKKWLSVFRGRIRRRLGRHDWLLWGLVWLSNPADMGNRSLEGWWELTPYDRW